MTDLHTPVPTLTRPVLGEAGVDVPVPEVLTGSGETPPPDEQLRERFRPVFERIAEGALASHNPVVLKERTIGAYALNGTSPSAGFVTTVAPRGQAG